MDFRFAMPWMLLLLIIPVVILWRRERRSGAAFPGFFIASQALRPSRGPMIFRMLMATGLACLAIAAARPQFGRTIVEREQSGRDLMLIIDLSGSMRVDDLVTTDGKRTDRLAVVFEAAKVFIDKRPNDRIGLVFFSSTALTSCPLTYDHQTVTQFLERTERQQRAMWDSGHEEGLLGGATNIGLGLGIALKRVREANAQGRAMILITDGADSRDLPGWVDPLQAARRADDEKVKIYGIGVGNPEGTMTQRDMFGRVASARVPTQLLPDMSRLENIARTGGGLAFAASDQAGLLRVLDRIDALEPTARTIRSRDDYSDRFMWALIAGLSCMVLALGLEPRLRGVA